MCNCKSTCNNCSTGLSCQCPADYSIIPAIPDCHCCAQGYTYIGITPNYPSGACRSITTPYQYSVPISCTPCEETISTDCIVYSCTSNNAANTCPTCDSAGIVNGDSLTTMIAKLCPSTKANIMAIIQNIALDVDLIAGLCNLVSHCGLIPGSSTPVIGAISFSIP